jgi:nanoRNase/pAp phosphatase (c-di-AMP/oligoRNAs hydrolase)
VTALVHRPSIGHELATRKAFAAQCGLVSRLTERRVDCSIYSIGDFDVASLAATYGGGGHRNAAGFSVTLEEWLARFV